jgi:glutamate--cysteine ligase catalytic subunit
MYNFLKEYFGKDCFLSVSSYPMLGVDEYYKEYKPINDTSKSTSEDIIKQNQNHMISNLEEEFKFIDINSNPYSQSNYAKDVSITNHPRFFMLTKNIRNRRGCKVDVRIPIYRDEKTNLTTATLDEPYPGFIHMDAMVFGMGNCCLQATVGSPSLNGAIYIYDQFIPLAPILLALTSSSPIFKGKLSDIDNRFNILEQSVDDRTEEEKNPYSERYIYKSRYSSAYSYISDNIYVQDFHNDYPKFPINNEYMETFLENHVPRRLAEHFCNILARDPLVIFENKIKTAKNDRTNLDSNFISTNWNSLRIKPPKEEDKDSCFKVEIRPCELQITPFENIAILELILLFYNSIMKYDVNFIIPITKVDENFKRAYKRDAIIKEKFFWRVNGLDKNFKEANWAENNYLKPDDNNIPSSIFNKEEDSLSIKELTIQEILLGSEEHNYPGILKLSELTIDKVYNDEDEKKKMKISLEFLVKRAKGIFIYN